MSEVINGGTKVLVNPIEMWLGEKRLGVSSHKSPYALKVWGDRELFQIPFLMELFHTCF